MSQSLSKLFVHVIFSTKNRQQLITPDIRDELNAYLAGILKKLDCMPFIIGCVSNHVHILFQLSKNISLAKVIEPLKKGSSKWMKTKSPALGDFYWQTGYGAFSVSQSNVASVKEYIAGQEEHHRVTTFEDEFRKFLDRHNIEYDERYVWD